MVYHNCIAIRAVWRESSPARTAEGATGPETLRPMYDSLSRSLESDPARGEDPPKGNSEPPGALDLSGLKDRGAGRH
jgi:hypothetical protein